YNIVEESRRSKKRDINVVGQSKSDNRQQSIIHFSLCRTIATVKEWKLSENRNSRKIDPQSNNQSREPNFEKTEI
uniref:Ovule protein n=1 Tax=Romanomermis culicivorax TaxID=13658 RepID=A0A915JXH6_ROMCU